jgi:MHS family proline/betaine transporter-like MFS transporter
LIVIAIMGLIGGLMLPETSKVSLHGASAAHPDASAAAAALKSVPGSAA